MVARAVGRGFAVSVAALWLGCATLSGDDATSAPCADVLRDPSQLEQLANAALAQQDFALAYRYLSLIHILHPDSAKNREVYPLAARLYRVNWAPHRTEIESVWVTSEPQFMIAWLAGFFEDGKEFPQEQVDQLFLGMNYGFFREFLAYAQGHPRMSRWQITAEKENGVVEKISASAR